MEAYRDQYATLFNNGKKVVVLGVSVDADTMLANWARESSFPMLYGSDPDQKVGKLYGSTRGKIDTRNLFVIGPDGRITFKQTPVNVLSQEAYAELGKAVARTMGTPAASSSGGRE
jgi:peroxiredoxin Q/BCP